jgi:hypothetical protein
MAWITEAQQTFSYFEPTPSVLCSHGHEQYLTWPMSKGLVSSPVTHSAQDAETNAQTLKFLQSFGCSVGTVHLVNRESGLLKLAVG